MHGVYVLASEFAIEWDKLWMTSFSLAAWVFRFRLFKD
jgi:hypothetical protein